MACKEELVTQGCEIHVCFDAEISRWERLRFALLVRWFPGKLVWSVLHLLLVVVASALLLVAVPFLYAYLLLLDVTLVLTFAFSFLCYVPVVVLICSACIGWSLVFESAPVRHQLRDARAWIVSHRNSELVRFGCRCFPMTRTLHKGFVEDVRACCGRIARWCEEVVLMHDAIAVV